jgi:hypothetical protein
MANLFPVFDHDTGEEMLIGTAQIVSVKIVKNVQHTPAGTIIKLANGDSIHAREDLEQILAASHV